MSRLMLVSGPATPFAPARHSTKTWVSEPLSPELSSSHAVMNTASPDATARRNEHRLTLFGGAKSRRTPESGQETSMLALWF
jgi:hypothetical protein